MFIDLNILGINTLRFHSFAVRRRTRTRFSLVPGLLRTKSLNMQPEPEVELEAISTFENLSVNTSSSQTVECASLVNVSQGKFTTDPSTSQRSDQMNNNDTKKLKRSNEKRPPHEVRYDQRGHFVKFDDEKNATRCKNENCKTKSRTHMYCVKCNVHLCVAKGQNCFYDFHVLVLPEN